MTRSSCLTFAALTLLGACVYPRNSTTMHAVGSAKPVHETPEHLWTVRVLHAHVPPRKPMGLTWDEDGSLPDPFVRILVDGRIVWESEVIRDTLKPEWSVTLPRNVFIGPDSELRLELWDKDAATTADPIGQYAHRGVPPGAPPGALARVSMANGATLTYMLSPPQAHRGTGIQLYEVGYDELRVVEVTEDSPAFRAGILPGDRITGIDHKAISDMGTAKAASELSLAGERTTLLDVVGTDGQLRQVKLDGGYIWLTM